MGGRGKGVKCSERRAAYSLPVANSAASIPDSQLAVTNASAVGGQCGRRVRHESQRPLEVRHGPITSTGFEVTERDTNVDAGIRRIER